MTVIDMSDLTPAEWKTIEEHSDGDHHSVWFWVGFIDHQNGRSRPNDWSNTAAREAWGRGWEASMRTRLGRKPRREWTEYDYDDSDTLNQLSGLRSAAKKRRAGREKIVGLIQPRSQHLAKHDRRRPRLVVDNTK